MKFALIASALLASTLTLAQAPDPAKIHEARVQALIQNNDPALGASPDKVQFAKDLLERKQYQSVLNLVGALEGQVVALASAEDSLYQKTLALNLQISTLKENQLSAEAERLNQLKKVADRTRGEVISAIEATAPGMKWDERQGKLVVPPDAAKAKADTEAGRGAADAAVANRNELKKP